MARLDTLGHDHARAWDRRDASLDDGDRRPRVLLEDADPGEAFSYWNLLEGDGYEVSWCPGPAGVTPGAPRRRCPLLDSGTCALVEEADVVVCALGTADKDNRRIVHLLGRHYRDTPVIVQATQSAAQRWSSVVDGHALLRIPVTASGLLGSIRRALGRPRARRPVPG